MTRHHTGLGRHGQRTFIAAALGVACAPALGQATFFGMGDLPGGSAYSEGLGVASDGYGALGASIERSD